MTTPSFLALPDELLALLRGANPCHIATTMPDGSPQLTQTWVDTDGEHVLINTVEGFQKVRNVRRDPRVALTVTDGERPNRYVAVRGRVVAMTTEGGAEHIEQLSWRYQGRPYEWWGGRDQQRIILSIAAERLHAMGA